MSPIAKRLIATWFFGTIVGTLLIAVTSPLFVRSYLPLSPDDARQVWTLAPNQVYRWRSEGYANTYVGDHGMPGRADLPNPQPGILRVALWGDSQAEGVAVADDQKLFAQAERAAETSDFPIEVLPLTRSGENAADWLTQIPLVESRWSIDAHVILVVDLEDLLHATTAPLPPPALSDVAQANAALAMTAPAFVIQGARYLLREPDEATHRTLRFSLGPIPKPIKVEGNEPPKTIEWSAPMQAIAQTAKRPVVILYAPQLPMIFHGKVIIEDRRQSMFADLQQAAIANGLTVVDARQALRRSALDGEWPHGFHNGYIGAGHLNATGYRIVGRQLVLGVQQSIESAD